MNRVLLLLIILFTGETAVAQVNRYMVFFRDKNNVGYTISNPGDFLTPRSLERRQKQNLSIDATDLPVNQGYVSGLDSAGAITFYTTKWLNGVLVECTDSLIETLLSLPYVKNYEYVAPGPRPQVRAYSFFGGGTDPSSQSRKSDLVNAAQNNMLGIGDMHQQGYDGTGILIGVLDAGFIGMDNSDYFRQLFTGNKILGERDFVSGSGSVFSHDTHGTEVMSCIAGYKAGVYESGAYNSDFVLCVTEDDPTEYRVEEYNWIFGAEYADSLGADIINSSLGYNTFDDTTMNYTYAQMDGKTAVITRGAEMAANKGMLVVVSVGNEGSNSWKKLVAPADGDSVLSVGAVDLAGRQAYFSSDGPSADGRIKPEVAAPGSSVRIVSAMNTVIIGDGTSYSAPLVTGLAAGVWQAYPDLNNMELREVIEKGSSQYSTPDTLLGYGIPDFVKIQSVTALSDDLPVGLYKVYPNPVQHKRLFIEYSPEYSGSPLDVEIYNTQGKSCLDTTIKMNRKNYKAELNLEELVPGIYILCLNSKAGKGKVRLLVP